MRAIRFGCLLFASAAAIVAQMATVQNAALYQGSAVYPAFSSTPFLVGFVVYPGLVASTPNIISPRMLAVLSYPVPFPNPFASPVAQPVNAALYLRPAGSTTPIPVSNIISAVDGAVTFVVPGYMPLGGAELLYQIDNGPTQWTTVNVVQSSFAFFRDSAIGPAIAQAFSPTGSSSNVGLATPLQPGQTLQLTGSGLGYGTSVTATIGGINATVLYAGPNGTMAGHDQIQLQVPTGVTPGCYVPVSVTYNQAALATTVSITSDGSPCKHPWQLSLSDLKTLDSGGSLADGIITLQTALSVVTAAAGSRNETAYLDLSTIGASQLANYFSPPPTATSCTVPTAAGVAIFAASFLASIPANIPDIGSSVTLQSPTTAIQLSQNPLSLIGPFNSTNLPPPVDGPLSNLPIPAIAGGKWMFQSSGGPDLPPSSFGFTLPAPVQLAGGVPVMLNHTQDQTISWNGAAFDAGATASISLSGTGTLFCNAPAASGTLTIPSAMLSGFGANTIGTLTINIVEAGAYLPHTEFQTNEGNSLLLFVPFTSSDSRPVFFRNSSGLYKSRYGNL